MVTMSASTNHKPTVSVQIDQSDDDSESMAEMSDTSENGATASDSEMDTSTEHVISNSEDPSNPETEDDVVQRNDGWADSMSKILSMGKPKGKKSLVLAKAKKLADVQPKASPSDVEIVKVDGNKLEDKSELDGIKTEVEETERQKARKRVRKKNEMPSIRTKPKVLEKERERTLTKIATRGVVQLFNAVRNQQKTIDTQLEDAGPLERKKDKVLKKFDKRSFLDALMGPTRSTVVDQVSKKPKKETKVEEVKPKWDVLRDDFMMGAKMKDWDKATDVEADDN